MSRFATLAYTLIAYGAFNAWFLYMIAFLNEWPVPKTINSGQVGPPGVVIAMNVGLMALFALQHTVMARPAFKQRVFGATNRAVERASFVLISALVLGLLLWQWRPLPGVIWRAEGTTLASSLRVLSVAGALLVLYSTFLVDHFDLVGLRQAWVEFCGHDPKGPVFKERSLYRVVRHPMMLGILLWFWATPNFTWGRLLFCTAMTAYILFGIAMEERGLLAELGDDYADYRRRVPKLLPMPRPAKQKSTDN